MSEKGLTVRSIDDVERLARIAVASGYTSCRKAEEAAMLIITGHELGLSPAQSLRGIYVVNGKPVLSADLMVAVVRRSGLCESWRVVESTAERCTITTRRKGESQDATRTWTMADAKRAGITSKGTWAAYPAAMLRHRCASDLARQEYSDVIMGLYDPEELDADHLVATPLPAPMTPATLDGMGVEQPRQIAAPAPKAPQPGDDIPHDVRVRARELAGQDCTAAEWQRAVDEAMAEHETAARIAQEVNDLRAQAARAESLSALAGLWIAAKADVAALDDRDAQERVWSAFKARARDFGATVKALRAEIAKQSPQPPPDGTDGPSGPRSAANDVAAEGTAEGAAPAQGSVAMLAAHPDAWRLSREGITAHVRAITVIPRLANSGRRHLPVIPEALREHALRAYADRFAALARDASEAEARRTAETWLREGPKVATLPAPVRAAGGAR